MPNDRPRNRKGGSTPSDRGSRTPKPQPYKKGPGGKGTTHGKKKTAGSGQSRPPDRPCSADLIRVPVTIVKLLFGWRPPGYQVADIPWSI